MSAVYWRMDSRMIREFAKLKWLCGLVIPPRGIMYKSADVGGSKL